MDRYDKVMEGAAIWGAFYRQNPEKFAEDYLHIQLRLFQKILISMMFWCTTFVWIAARGASKSFLSAVYAVIRSILYPGSKTCIASKVRSQGINVLEKIIHELVPRSVELNEEIDWKKTQINGTNAIIVFKNSSTIQVVTASDTSRGKRASVLLLDEYRLINKNTVDDILKKFLNWRRTPPYSELSKEQRKIEYAKEKNITLYLSSAWWKDSWAYTKCVDTFKAMVNPARHQFVCAFPYELSIEEGLLDPDSVAESFLESDFSDIRWGMEMDAMFYGADDGAFFDFDSISKCRKIKYPMLPDKISAKVNNSSMVHIPPKQNGEIRILSADIALMSSTKHNNDATAVFVNQLTRTKSGRYLSNIVYGNSYEGLHTDDQALEIRRLYDEYMCDYIVLDAAGIGLGVADCLFRDIVDPESGEIYPALSCCNNPEMAARCTVPGADKVIWAIKASAQFNSDAAFLLREGFRSGRIRLLETEFESEDLLKEIRGFKSLNPQERIQFQLPYIQTTLLIDELIKLRHEESNGRVRVYERSGMRKDRYSSLAYNYYVATQLETKLTKKYNMNIENTDLFVIKPPSNGKAVSMRFGAKENKTSWR